MAAYQINVHHAAFTQWCNSYFGTNFTEHSGVPTAEWNAALPLLNMKHVNFLGSGTSSATYVLFGGEMAQKTGLDKY